jgi:hypothetical protein
MAQNWFTGAALRAKAQALREHGVSDRTKLILLTAAFFVGFSFAVMNIISKIKFFNLISE